MDFMPATRSAWVVTEAIALTLEEVLEVDPRDSWEDKVYLEVEVASVVATVAALAADTAVAMAAATAEVA